MKLLLTIFIFLVFFGCEQTEEEVIITFEIDPRLEQDNNGFYHLTLNRETFQSVHRLSGHIYEDGEPLDQIRFEWESSHYWYLGDTLGYIVQVGLTPEYEYISFDTSYVFGFDGFVVPTINCCSYSNSEGEVNTMFGPVRTMIGDTVRITINCILSEELSQEFEVILD